MSEKSDLMARSASLNHEAGELEAKAGKEEILGTLQNNVSDEMFNKLADHQIGADWHFQLAYTARRKANKKRKEADKLERKAIRIARRTKSPKHL